MKLHGPGGARDVSLKPDQASLDGRSVSARPIRERDELVAVEIDGMVVPVRVARKSGRILVWCGGRVYEFTSGPPRSSAGADHAGDLLSPMPGRVRRTLVAPGESVTQGQVVMILEAMKMEHAIRAPRDGIVTRIAHAEGDLVDAGVALAELAPRDPVLSGEVQDPSLRSG